MNGKRKCAKVFMRNAIIIFMTFAMILTAPGLGICLSAIDISKRGNVTPVTDIAGKFEEISGIDEIDLKDAVYYSKPQNLSEVGKFKEALKKGKSRLQREKEPRRYPRRFLICCRISIKKRQMRSRPRPTITAQIYALRI